MSYVKHFSCICSWKKQSTRVFYTSVACIVTDVTFHYAVTTADLLCPVSVCINIHSVCINRVQHDLVIHTTVGTVIKVLEIS